MLNKIQIIGRMGKDPEVRYMSNGDAVCNFSVATTEKWKDKTTGETKENTTWHRVSAWGRQAEVVGEYLRKGSKVYVEGKQVCRKYTDKDGKERESWEIRMQEMEMLDGKQEGQAGTPPTKPQQADSGFDDDGEIPF